MRPGARRSSPLSRLRSYLASAVDRKLSRGEDLTAIAQMWRDENNAVLRQQVTAASIGTLTPMLAAIIRQGAGADVLSAAASRHG
jgi:hypothetical protein